MIRHRIFWSALICMMGVHVLCAQQLLQERNTVIPCITSVEQVCALYPANAQAAIDMTNASIKETQDGINALCALPQKERTYANTVRALDDIIGSIGAVSSLLWMARSTSPDDALRTAARQELIRLSEWCTEHLDENIDIYHAIKSYFDGAYQKEKDQLLEEERYLVREVIRAFEKKGFDLPQEERDEILEIKKELAQLTSDFANNIASDIRTISVSRDQLAGLEDDFIDSLTQTDDGNYTVGVDYPTYFAVMKHCTVQATRKALWEQFNRRGYPDNCAVLEKIIALRDKLARMLGFASFAHLDLDGTMAKSPEHVHEFLDQLLRDIEPKVRQDMEFIAQHMPDDVSLRNGALEHWDLNYVFNRIEEKEFALDDRLISEYFPTESTLNAILDVYQEFLGINFSRVACPGAWHKDVLCVQVDDSDGKLLGYLFLDLYPRDNKYTHACEIDLVAPYIAPDGSRCAGAIGVIANFPKPRAGKPALLTLSDVRTFFHEFGHAMHAMLGATHTHNFSGTEVKFDFVETPSQMFEQWLSSPDVLRRLSSHYKTGKSLPDDIIEKLKQARLFGKGALTKRQVALAKLSLACFAQGEKKNPYHVQDTCMSLVNDVFAPAPEDYFICAFGHLGGYAAKYYCYLWSQVYALDLFGEIAQEGLFNKAMGERIKNEVLGLGGSVPADKLLKDFLGREPNNKAFLKYLGL